MRGYLVRPAGATGKLPGVLVVHENRGLNPHIEDIARRLALDNFMAFAPDALVPARRLSRRRGQGARALPEARSGQDARGLRRGRGVPQGAARLHRPGRRRRLLLRRRHRQHAGDARAGSRGGVPFYGSQPAAEDVPKIKAPLLIHFAENDERINAGWPAYEAALKATTSSTRRTSTRARSTASTTTRRRATTRRPRSSRGSGRWTSSTRICGSSVESWRGRVVEGRRERVQPGGPKTNGDARRGVAQSSTLGLTSVASARARRDRYQTCGLFFVRLRCASFLRVEPVTPSPP